MAQQNRTYLKTRFEQGDKPNEQDFIDLIDSSPNFADGDNGITGVAWGDITGTLSNQTDLNTELSGKEPAFVKNTGFNKDLGTTAGTVSEGNHTHTFFNNTLAVNSALPSTGEALEVTGKGYFNGDSTSIILHREGTGNPGIEFTNNNGTVANIFGGYLGTAGIKIRQAGNSASDFNIDALGNVEISGTTTMSNSCDIKGTGVRSFSVYDNTEVNENFKAGTQLGEGYMLVRNGTDTINSVVFQASSSGGKGSITDSLMIGETGYATKGKLEVVGQADITVTSASSVGTAPLTLGSTNAFSPTYMMYFNIAGSSGGGISTTQGGTPVFFSGSDMRLKNNIANAEVSAVDKLCSAELKEYNLNIEKEGATKHFGWVAQDWKDIIPGFVLEGESEDDMLSVTPQTLLPYFHKAIQELKAEIESLKQQINNN